MLRRGHNNKEYHVDQVGGPAALAILTLWPLSFCRNGGVVYKAVSSELRNNNGGRRLVG